MSSNIPTRRATLTGLLLATNMTALPFGATAATRALPYRWRNVRVGGGGFVPNVVFSRVEKGLAYLRSDMGGAYRWQATEGRWIPLLDDQAQGSWQGVESVAPDPLDPNVVYLACGMGRPDPAAILRSDNRGTDWTVAPVPFRMGGNEDGRGLGERLAIDPNDTRTLYFASRHDGLQVSRDRGATWTKSASFPLPGLGLNARPAPTHGGLSFVIFDPRGGKPGEGSRTIFVGVADPSEHHLWRSGDGGASWKPIPAPHAYLACKAALDGEGRLYVTYSSGIGPSNVQGGAVWRLDTATNAWTEITPAKPLPQRGGGFMGVAVDGSGAVAVTSLNRWNPHDALWRSTDHGATWTDLYPDARRDVTTTPFLYWGEPRADFGWWMAGLAIDPFDPDFACYTTGATIYATREFTKAAAGRPTTWFPWVEGIEQTAIITLASLPEGPQLLSGFGDISGFVHDDLTVSPTDQFTTPVFGNTNFIDYAGGKPAIVVRSGTPHQRHGGPTLAWSGDHGRTWAPMSAPRIPGAPPPPGQGRRGPDPHDDAAIVVNADGSVFMVMTAQAQVTRDRGASWTASQGLPAWVRPVPDRVDPRRFTAIDTQTGKRFLSTDAGASFAPAPTRGLPADLSADQVTWREIPWPLKAAPGQAGHLWFVSTQGLFRSTDGGARFTRIDGDVQVDQLDLGAPPPGKAWPALFAIGRKDGIRAVWRSDDEGKSWVRVNDGRHEYGRRFRCLAADMRVYGRVYVGTDGRGIVYGEPG